MYKSTTHRSKHIFKQESSVKNSIKSFYPWLNFKKTSYRCEIRWRVCFVWNSGKTEQWKIAVLNVIYESFFVDFKQKMVLTLHRSAFTHRDHVLFVRQLFNFENRSQNWPELTRIDQLILPISSSSVNDQISVALKILRGLKILGP